MLKIAEAYFLRLLNETEPSHAVSALSGDWRSRVNPALPRFGLAEPEYLVQLCLIYIGQVGHGGHGLFFMNCGGRHIDDMLGALAAVGLPELQETLRRAANEFPGQSVPDSTDEAEEVYGNLPEEVLSRLEALDKQVWRAVDVSGSLMQYLRANRDKILLPERDLSAGTDAG